MACQNTINSCFGVSLVLLMVSKANDSTTGSSDKVHEKLV